MLKKAVKTVPEDPVIAEHLGDVYSADSSKIKAVNIYKKALVLDPENKSILDKIRKIERLLK